MYDLHIAAEGNVDALQRDLLRIGFVDDRLIHEQTNLGLAAMHYLACPIYGLHMTLGLPINDRAELSGQIKKLSGVLAKHPHAHGYWHAEHEAHCETTQPSAERFKMGVDFPHDPLDAQPRPEPKKWDIHLSVYTDELPDGLLGMFLRWGWYWIVRTDGVHEWTSFTIQGINDVQFGYTLYQNMLRWCERACMPSVRIKFETTVHQEIFGNPTLIPPTIA